MLSIVEITEEPRQEFTLPIIGYSDATMLLEWKETQSAWFMTLTWGDRVLSNLRVSRADNIISAYRTSFPFGINVTTTNRQDPITDTAFSKDGAILSILSEAELIQYGI
jgi:hypothetical protein